MANILVVDDQKEIRTLIERILVRENHSIYQAADGNEGLAVFETESIDLIITDLLMPEKEGMEMIKQIRKTHPAIKIIAISGGGIVDSATYLHVASILGANKTISKPFKAADLIAAVNELLQNS